MKVLHCCLAAFYIDNYGYQENILPKMHKLQGHDVKIIASTESYIDNKTLGYLEPGSYINENGIPVTRLPYVKWLPKQIGKKLRIYPGLDKLISDFVPDIIFLHDTQFMGIAAVARYARKHKNVKIYADGHTDFVNSARGWVSKNILHKIIYRRCALKIEPYTRKFYGTLPARIDFIHEVYGIPSSKIELLELGADDSIFDLSRKDEIRAAKRKEQGIAEDDFVLISGGKIDHRKNIHLLVEAMKAFPDPKVKLVLFGTPDNEMQYLLGEMEQADNIIYLGWQGTKEIYDLLFAADLGFFPGTHSVLWEQVCGVGLPAVFKGWDKIRHVDVGGNCIFLEDVSTGTIKEMILYLCNRNENFEKMKKAAEQKGISRFAYSSIARRAIEQD